MLCTVLVAVLWVERTRMFIRDVGWGVTEVLWSCVGFCKVAGSFETEEEE